MTGRPSGLRQDAPLLDAWLSFEEAVARGGIRPFTVPGHKQRLDLVGDVVAGDVPLYGGLDTVKQTGGLLIEAERRAARFWGAEWCRFSVGGSTHGNQALALAVGQPGDEVVVGRTLHRSLLLGLVLAGLRPVWVRPAVDVATGLPGAVPVASVRKALTEHPRAVAVFVGDPSYVGTVGDVAGQAEAAHTAGVPLVVDAAWGAHFGLHPALPPHPLAAGADAVVTSAHKMLPALSQGALLLARTERLDAGRLDRAFDATHTTSPSGAILASVDAARALVERSGAELAEGLVGAVSAARGRLASVPGVRVLAGHLADGSRVDAARLVVLLAGTGAHGVAVERDLVAAGYPVEMADRDTIVAIATLADDLVTVGAFAAELARVIDRHRGSPRAVVPAAAWTVEPEQLLAPRAAFFAPREHVPAASAVGRVSAELVAPYPPGVPVLAPGELITAAGLAALEAARDDGALIAYAADPSLATIAVARAGWPT